MARREAVEQVRQFLQDPNNIRNISVIAHVDHGKSTLSDGLVSSAGLMNKNKAGNALIMDVGAEEKERGITIKSTAISLPFVRDAPARSKHFNPNWPGPKPAVEEQTEEVKAKTPAKQHFLINLIDSPGHVDFSSEVSAALRVTDGAMVVVDCIESVCVQTRTVLQQAIAERIRPVLFMNKMDRIFMELHMDPEEAYQTLRRSVESVNVVISTYSSPEDPLGDVTVYPQAGTVAFGSGLQGWGFTLAHFAKMHHDTFNMPVKKLMKKLWGDWFFDVKTKTFVSEQYTATGKARERAFVMLVLKPLRKLFDTVLKGDEETTEKFIKKQQLSALLPPAKEWELMSPKDHLKAIMKAWMPCGDCMRDLIIDHLPSPKEAQKYRCMNLYAGPQDDAACNAIRACNPNGPVMLYVSKMVPTSDNSHFYAFGRVFSGTVKAGMEVRIQGPDYVPGVEHPVDVSVKKITGTVVMMGPHIAGMSAVPCGNLVGLVGVDQYLVKTGTITTLPDAHNFVDMKYSVAPVVRRAVEPKNPAHLPKLSLGLRRLVKYDPLLRVYTTKEGEHIIAGSGELHLDVCLNALRNDFMGGAEIRVHDPIVSYAETVTQPSSQVCIGKSGNKHNRLYLTAEPLDQELCAAIERGEFRNVPDKQRASALVTEHKWDKDDARKLWGFGMAPDGEANALVDQSKGVSYLHDIKDSVCSSFGRLTNQGVLTGEPLRGVRFNVQDAKVHADAPHRSPDQIEKMTRDAIYACQLASEPRLLEPVYQCDVVVPQAYIAGVFDTLRKRRATILGTEDTDNAASPQRVVKAHLPVSESFGFTSDLRGSTSGQAFPQLVFSHWEIVPGDVNDPSSMAYKIMMAIRKRKGMKLEVPKVSDFHVKL